MFISSKFTNQKVKASDIPYTNKIVDKKYQKNIGDYTYGSPRILDWNEGAKLYIEKFSSLLSPNGIILFHDVLVDKSTFGYDFGIKNYYHRKLKKNSKFSTFRIPLWPGLCLTQRNNSSLLLSPTPNNFFSKIFTWKK